MLIDRFINGTIGISINSSDPPEYIELMNQILSDAFYSHLGHDVGFGDRTIQEFVKYRFVRYDDTEIQISYNYFRDGSMGFINDDPEWYPEHGVSIVPLYECISEKYDVQQVVDEADFMSVLEEVV